MKILSLEFWAAAHIVVWLLYIRVPGSIQGGSLSECAGHRLLIRLTVPFNPSATRFSFGDWASESGIIRMRLRALLQSAAADAACGKTALPAQSSSEEQHAIFLGKALRHHQHADRCH